MADGASAPHQTFRRDVPLDLLGRPTDDERMLQDAAGSCARETLLPGGVEAVRDETLNRAIVGESAV